MVRTSYWRQVLYGKILHGLGWMRYLCQIMSIALGVERNGSFAPYSSQCIIEANATWTSSATAAPALVRARVSALCNGFREAFLNSKG